MARKKTKGSTNSGLRAKMRLLEKELRRQGYRVSLWKRLGKPLSRLMLYMALLAGLGWALILLWQHYLSTYNAFAISEIEYHSNGILSERQAMALIELDSSVNMITVKPEELERKLRDYPPVKKASVKRKLPTSLLIEVDMRVPVAWIHCPGVGARSYDMDKGIFIDADAIVFFSVPDLYEAYRGVPVLKIPAPPSGELPGGTHLNNYQTAVALIETLNREKPPGASKARIVESANEWSYKVEFDDGSIATFGLFEIERQVANYYLAVDNARKTGRKIKTINLIPSRNIPVIYDEGYQDIPLAEPVS